MKFNNCIKNIILYIIQKLFLKKNDNIEKYFIKIESNYSLKYFININDSLCFNIIKIEYFFSIKYNLLKLKYKILVFDKNKNIILPSDLSLYNNLHIFCIIKIINKNITINSFPNINKNKYYECIEFININEKIKIGIKIYKSKENNENIDNFKYYFFLEKIIKYKKLKYKNNKLFDPLLLNKEYIRLYKRILNLKVSKIFRLKKLYIQFPIYSLKRQITIYENNWYFRNLNNQYYCFCKGLICPMNKNYQYCKFHIFLNIIDKSRKLFKKEDYLFLDFVFYEYSSDDVYPIFKEMSLQKLPVHYLTENMDIYNQYCYKIDKCVDIIYVNKNNYTINGNFLENYLTLILKLKQVISAGGINIFYFENLFYNIEYITYICVGHGVSFFKHFLYNYYNWYGSKVYDKILLPPSSKLISVASKYGWKEENIIKINLPRWDKYNFNNFYKDKSSINNNCIFIMFTWRKIKKGKNISFYYLKNIKNLINNEKLHQYLRNKKILLYFTLHHKLNKYKTIFKKNKYLNFIEEDRISECLSKINLVISDFSSIIFDIIYRRKPFIIYIPDANDREIEHIYQRAYYELIQSLKNDTIYFENKFFNITGVINKIIYYIDNNFILDDKLEKFYDTFEFRKGNNTIEFIKYISSII